MNTIEDCRGLQRVRMQRPCAIGQRQRREGVLGRDRIKKKADSLRLPTAARNAKIRDETGALTRTRLHVP